MTTSDSPAALTKVTREFSLRLVSSCSRFPKGTAGRSCSKWTTSWPGAENTQATRPNSKNTRLFILQSNSSLENCVFPKIHRHNATCTALRVWQFFSTDWRQMLFPMLISLFWIEEPQKTERVQATYFQAQKHHKKKTNMIFNSALVSHLQFGTHLWDQDPRSSGHEGPYIPEVAQEKRAQVVSKKQKKKGFCWQTQGLPVPRILTYLCDGQRSTAVHGTKQEGLWFCQLDRTVWWWSSFISSSVA